MPTVTIQRWWILASQDLELGRGDKMRTKIMIYSKEMSMYQKHKWIYIKHKITSNKKTIYVCVNMYIYLCMYVYIYTHIYMKIYFIDLHIYIWNIWESYKEYSPCRSSQCEWDWSEEKLKRAWAFFICFQFPCAPLGVSISPRGCDSSACYVFF